MAAGTTAMSTDPLITAMDKDCLKSRGKISGLDIGGHKIR